MIWADKVVNMKMKNRLATSFWAWGDGTQAGFGLLELIVAMGLFMIVVSAGAGGILKSYSLNRLADEEVDATLFVNEGLDAARSIANQDWANLSAGTYGVDSGGGTWAFAGSSNFSGPLTREVIVSEVYRDVTGNIVSSGGTLDPDTFKVESVVTWDFTPTRNNTVSSLAYLTNFRKPIAPAAGDWTNPSQQSSVNLSSNENGWKIQVEGSYAYIVRRGGNTDFAVVNVSNLSAPSLAGELGLSGSPYNLSKVGDYVYEASDRNDQELQVINVSNPSSPSLAGSDNLSGNRDLYGVFAVGSLAYGARDSSGDDELIVFNISNPNNPSILGSTDLGSDANDIVVVGNYAYVASDDNNELQVIDISNSSSPNYVAGFDPAGNSNGSAIDAEGSIAVLGRENGDVEIIDISNPTSPVGLGTFDAGDHVGDVDYVASLNYVFIASDENSAEFQLIDISNPASPSLVGSLNLPSDLNGIFYDETVDRAFGVGDDNAEEFIIIQPS